MNRKLMFTRILGACVLACPLIAQAAIPLSVYQGMVVPLPVKYANQGYFWGMEGGLPRFTSINYSGSNTSQTNVTAPTTITTTDTTFLTQPIQFGIDTGFMGGLTFGYRYTYLRLETEAVVYRSSVGAVSVPALTKKTVSVSITPNPPPTPTTPPTPPAPPNVTITYVPNIFSTARASSNGDFGSFIAVAFMANFVLDLNISGTGLFPFIGGGVGGALTSVAPKIKTNFTFTPNNKISFRSSNTQLALQFIGGVGFALTDHMEGDIVYKYFITDNSDNQINTPPLDSNSTFVTTPLVPLNLVSQNKLKITTIAIELRFN